MKHLDIHSLNELINTHSVTGDTEGVINYLQNRLKNIGIKSEITDFGVLIFGNFKNPKTLISAHADEIGFQIVKQTPESTFLVRNSGHVNPTMLNNSVVYVETKKGKIYGSFYPKKELGDNNPTNFTEIFLDTVDNTAIQVGDFGSYNRTFFQDGDKIIATGLDNKISVQMILELVEEYPNFLQDTMFAFVTEEEAKYDCIAGIAHIYQPQYAIVLDMLPCNQTSSTKVESLPEVGKGPAILYAMGTYHLHPILRRILSEVKYPYHKTFVDIPFPPEPQILQRNGTTKAMNVFIPMLGWHNCVYTMDVNDYISTKHLILNIKKILNKR